MATYGLSATNNFFKSINSIFYNIFKFINETVKGVYKGDLNKYQLIIHRKFFEIFFDD